MGMTEDRAAQWKAIQDIGKPKKPPSTNDSPLGIKDLLLTDKEIKEELKRYFTDEQMEMPEPYFEIISGIIAIVRKAQLAHCEPVIDRLEAENKALSGVVADFISFTARFEARIEELELYVNQVNPQRRSDSG